MSSIIPNGRGDCSVCEQEKITYQCKGCANDFCYKHLSEHRQIFIEQLGEVETDRDQFRDVFIQQRDNLPNHIRMQQINKWESDSIKKIKQTAEECRQIFMEQAIRCFNEIEVRLNLLNRQIIETREENEFNEIVLEQLRTRLTKLIAELAQAPDVTVNQDTSPYISKIFVVSTSSGKEISFQGQGQTRMSISEFVEAKYLQNGITVAGGNAQGLKLNQLARPEGIFVDDDLTMYIADSNNNRILKWKYGEKNGQIIAGGNGKGNRPDQLDEPTSVVYDKKTNSIIISDWGNRRIIQQINSTVQVLVSNIKCCSLALDKNGYLYVADWKKHEVKRWKIGESDGIVVAGGNGQGNGLNQLNCPNNIFVDNDSSLYISNYENHRVVKWAKGAKEGVLIAGQKGQGNGPQQLSVPQGITVDYFGHIYIADSENHRVICLGKRDAPEYVVVGGKGKGDQSSQLNTPIGLTVDKQGHLYVVDSENHRVQKFQLTTH